MPTMQREQTVTPDRAGASTQRTGRGFRIVESAIIERPVEKVFALAGDYENDPLWRSGVVEMRYEPPGAPRVGARTREVMQLFGRRVTTVAEVVGFERDRRTAFQARGGPVPVRGSRTFEPVGEGTRFTYELSAQPGGLWALLSPVLARTLRRQVEGDLKKLKTLLEQENLRSRSGPDGHQKRRSKDVPEDNIQVVEAVYDAFGRGDVPAIFGLFHPEAEVYQSSRLPWGGEYRGHEELGVFLTRLTGAIESQVEPERLIDDGERHVVQIGRTRGTVRETGARFDVPETHVWTVEDGKVLRFESYIDTAKMRGALGL